MMGLPEPERTLTLLVAGTGLRISEALGLQWQDVDYANQRINLGRVGLPTTRPESSATLIDERQDPVRRWHWLANETKLVPYLSLTWEGHRIYDSEHTRFWHAAQD